MKLLTDISQIPLGPVIIGFDPNPDSILMKTIEMFSKQGIRTFQCSPDEENICERFKIKQCPVVVVLKNLNEIFRRNRTVSFSELQEVIE